MSKFNRIEKQSKIGSIIYFENDWVFWIIREDHYCGMAKLINNDTRIETVYNYFRLYNWAEK